MSCWTRCRASSSPTERKYPTQVTRVAIMAALVTDIHIVQLIIAPVFAMLVSVTLGD
jgi:hypothetical protein